MIDITGIKSVLWDKQEKEIRIAFYNLEDMFRIVKEFTVVEEF